MPPDPTVFVRFSPGASEKLGGMSMVAVLLLAGYSSRENGAGHGYVTFAVTTKVEVVFTLTPVTLTIQGCMKYIE